MEKHTSLLQNVLRTISDLVSDTSVGPETTLEDLAVIKDEILIIEDGIRSDIAASEFQEDA